MIWINLPEIGLEEVKLSGMQMKNIGTFIDTVSTTPLLLLDSEGYELQDSDGYSLMSKG